MNLKVYNARYINQHGRMMLAWIFLWYFCSALRIVHLAFLIVAMIDTGMDTVPSIPWLPDNVASIRHVNSPMPIIHKTPLLDVFVSLCIH